jgi:SAM-dependent methyltransferase
VNVQQKADALPVDVFLGGPRNLFAAVGRLQLVSLLQEGLQPSSSVVDIGCGCLRGGYWLIHFLDPDRYFGIEPNEEMLKLGTDYFLEPETLRAKQPTFDGNADFDLSGFGVSFDYFLARSVWTHASKQQIETMLDGFVATAAPGATFLTSFFRAYRTEDDYRGTEWVGRSHESGEEAVVRHRLEWIRDVCRIRSLAVREVKADPVNLQRWLRITRAIDARQTNDRPVRASRKAVLVDAFYRLPKALRRPLAHVVKAGTGR